MRHQRTDGYDIVILSVHMIQGKKEDGYCASRPIVTRHEIIVALLRVRNFFITVWSDGLPYLDLDWKNS